MDSSNIPSNIFDGNGVFYSQTVALALYPCLVDYNTSVGGESWRLLVRRGSDGPCTMRLTRKCQANVIVQHDNFAYCPGVLKLQNRLLLDSEDYYIFPAHTDLEDDISGDAEQ